MNGKDTPAVAGARRVANWLKKQWGVHAKTCWQCDHSSGDTKKMCQAGREKAIAFYRARDELERIRKTESGRKGQGELF